MKAVIALCVAVFLIGAGGWPGLIAFCILGPIVLLAYATRGRC